MKFLPFSFLLAVCSLAPVYGFGGSPGSPFGNGEYFPNDGAFTAVVRGLNLVGTVYFSTSTTGGAGSTGVSTIYYNGESFRGNSQGSYNPSASTMAVNFQAAAQGTGENKLQIASGNSSLSSGATASEVTYFDSRNVDGAAQCRVSNAFPNQIFRGDGQASFRELLFNGYTPILADPVKIPINVSGVRIANAPVDYTQTDVRPPSVSESSTITPTSAP